MDKPQPTQHSSIPQFLLDTKNPWIIKHKSVLERLPDVESFLYSPPGTKYKTPTPQLQDQDASAGPAPTDDDVDPPLPLQLEVPANLFNTLTIKNGRYGRARAGWPNAHSRLEELQRCPAAALARVRGLDVEVWAHRGSPAAGESLQAEEWQDLEGPAGDGLLDLFASVLAAMTGLERLRWVMLPEFARRVREGLVGARGLLLPSVRRLEVGAFCEYMVDACPNVEVLEGEGLPPEVARQGEEEELEGYAEVLAEAAAKLPKVKEFSVRHFTDVTPSLISAMVKGMPRLARIRLHGRIPRPRPVRDPDSGEWRSGPGGVRLKDVLAVLAEFPDLEELDLPAPSDLHFGVLYGRRCDTNSLMLPAAERAYWNYRDHRAGCEKFEAVASMVLEKLPQLRRLVIDGEEPTIAASRDSKDGKAIASWPWSGRFDEYHKERFHFWEV